MISFQNLNEISYSSYSLHFFVGPLITNSLTLLLQVCVDNYHILMGLQKAFGLVCLFVSLSSITCKVPSNYITF